MSVRRCGLCGYQIRYHGVPEGTEPVEHVFCTLDNWRELEKENIDAGRLEWDYEEKFFYAWRCKRCGTFTFFNHLLKNIGTYTPQDEFSSARMRVPFERGPFWNDFQWFDITNTFTLPAEVFTKHSDNLWFAKNDEELRFYMDETQINCVAQFRRIEIVNPVTVATMSLAGFQKILTNWDDIEFTYHGVYYNFMREKDGSINIWRGQGYVHSCYSAAETDVNDIVRSHILQDGKSIAEVPSEIEL